MEEFIRTLLRSMLCPNWDVTPESTMSTSNDQPSIPHCSLTPNMFPSISRTHLVFPGEPVRLPSGNDCRCHPGRNQLGRQCLRPKRILPVHLDRVRYRHGPGSDLPAGHRERNDVLRKVAIAGHGNCRLRFRTGNVHLRSGYRHADQHVGLAACPAGAVRYCADQLQHFWGHVPTFGGFT